jgi:hypothetical protein
MRGHQSAESRGKSVRRFGIERWVAGTQLNAAAMVERQASVMSNAIASNISGNMGFATAGSHPSRACEVVAGAFDTTRSRSG